jgi:two-component system response regulator MtrA
VVSRRELLEHVWGVSPGNETRAVDVAVAGLRAKLERDPGAPAIVVSVKGAGYRWG